MISAKKYRIIVTFTFLLIVSAVSFGGYYIYKTFFNKETKEEVVQEVGDVFEDQEENNELLIELAVNESIVDDLHDVTIKIPVVSNPVIDGLNEKINDDLSKYYNDEKKYSIDYTSYQNNSLGSIIIRIKDGDEVIDYLTYNFDINRHEIVNNHYLLDYKDIKETEYHGILVKIYEEYLTKLINKDQEEKKDIDRKNSEYLKTISKENCSFDIPMFIDYDNHVNAIFREYRNNIETILIFNLNTLKIVEEIKGF